MIKWIKITVKSNGRAVPNKKQIKTIFKTYLKQIKILMVELT